MFLVLGIALLVLFVLWYRWRRLPRPLAPLRPLHVAVAAAALATAAGWVALDLAPAFGPDALVDQGAGAALMVPLQTFLAAALLARVRGGLYLAAGLGALAGIGLLLVVATGGAMMAATGAWPTTVTLVSAAVDLALAACAAQELWRPVRRRVA